MANTSEKQLSVELSKECTKKGYVTQLNAVTEQDCIALADRLGYAHHILAEGYALLLLLSPVSRYDFIWRDNTRFSAGWVKERVYFKEKNRWRWSDEYVQRADQDRFRFYQSERFESENSWDAFLAEEERLLNVRKGSERIVKVFPLVKAVDGDYPDAKTRSARQWELTAEKKFKCIAMIKPDRIIRRGEFDYGHLA